MSVLTVPCPGCQTVFKVPAERAGKKTKCPKCGTLFRIPGEEGSDSSFDGAHLKAVHAPAKSKPKAPGLKSPPKPADDVPMAKPVDERPAADPLSFDDDELPAVAASSGDPFSFDAAAAAAPPPKSKAKSKPALHEPAKAAVHAKQAYRDKSGGFGKAITLVVVFAVVVGGSIGGVMIYLNSQKENEQAKNDKSEKKEKQSEKAPTEVPKSPKKDESEKPSRVQPKKRAAPAPGILALAPGKPIVFLPLAAKRTFFQEPNPSLTIIPNLPEKASSAFDLARKVFPPWKRDTDIGVLWQTEAPFQGLGEKLHLGIYSPQSGKEFNHVDLEGDGLPEPICDLSVSADLFVHAHSGQNKITVWDTRKGTKTLDGFSPYVGKADLKIAAVYFTEPPDTILIVSTSGVVSGFKIATKEPLGGEFAPTKAAAKPLVAGKSIAPGPGRQSVVVVCGGALYEVQVMPAVTGAMLAEIGEVSRAFGLAASGADRFLYVFETDADGKKDKGLMVVRREGGPTAYRWPEKVPGTPVSAGWVGDGLAMIGTDRGDCLWFEAEGNAFRPLGLAVTPNNKARHVAADGQWSLLPDVADPKKCLLVGFSRPQEGLRSDVFDTAKQPPTVMLSEKGLFK